MANSNFTSDYFQKCEFLHNEDPQPTFAQLLETRTREGDITDALRFRVYDPLWMLSRQWQLGEFRGNNAGTAMSVRCKVRQSPMLRFKGFEKEGSNPASKNNEQWKTMRVIPPIEPDYERIERSITPIVRVESAAYFMDLAENSPEYPEISDRRNLNKQMCASFPLSLDYDTDEFCGRSSVPSDAVQAFTMHSNTRLERLLAAFGEKAFDGFALYENLSAMLKTDQAEFVGGITKALATNYVHWFSNRYLSNTPCSWDTKSLGYDVCVETPEYRYGNGSYTGGRLSWYSLDLYGQASNVGTSKVTTIKSLPTLATYPGAPNKRLWQFEDRKVFMGNSTGMQAKGNVAFLQYATMYGNDWMVFPLQTEFGQLLEVENIRVYDTFGIRTDIKTMAGTRDGGVWQMFTNAVNGKLYTHFAGTPGLLFTPSFPRTLEGEPLEQVNLLRDEMANMVWGVETRIEDGCGSSMDAKLLASDVEQFVEDTYQEEVEIARHSVEMEPGGQVRITSGRKADFKYQVMNSVPYNWIPFVPQHIKSEKDQRLYKDFLGGREVILRRGKMPVFFGERYTSVRPLSSILQVKPVVLENGKVGEEPLFINEEEVQGIGTQIVKNCQRARWLGGKTYTWMGYSRQIRYTQANSGLAFDNLEEIQ